MIFVRRPITTQHPITVYFAIIMFILIKFHKPFIYVLCSLLFMSFARLTFIVEWFTNKAFFGRWLRWQSMVTSRILFFWCSPLILKVFLQKDLKHGVKNEEKLIESWKSDNQKASEGWKFIRVNGKFSIETIRFSINYLSNID
jgi:hypothetical protein